MAFLPPLCMLLQKTLRRSRSRSTTLAIAVILLLGAVVLFLRSRRRGGRR